MRKSIEGVRAFQSQTFHQQKELFEQLAGKQQNPLALFITCSDSRINPNLITSTEPGELFILRNAGNIVPPFGAANGGEGATIEYDEGIDPDARTVGQAPSQEQRRDGAGMPPPVPTAPSSPGGLDRERIEAAQTWSHRGEHRLPGAQRKPDDRVEVGGIVGPDVHRHSAGVKSIIS